MKKFFILVLGMIMLMLIPINVKADDEVEIGVDQEESNIEYVEIDQEMESFSVGHKVSLSINPNVEKRIGSYKLEANKYVRLKFIYSSTSRVKVGIVNKSRNKVALKEIKSNDIQKIKVPKKDTYSVYIQNNSDKKITVSGTIILWKEGLWKIKIGKKSIQYNMEGDPKCKNAEVSYGQKNYNTK